MLRRGLLSSRRARCFFVPWTIPQDYFTSQCVWSVCVLEVRKAPLGIARFRVGARKKTKIIVEYKSVSFSKHFWRSEKATVHFCQPTVCGCLFDLYAFGLLHLQFLLSLVSDAVLRSPATFHVQGSFCELASHVVCEDRQHFE